LGTTCGLADAGTTAPPPGTYPALPDRRGFRMPHQGQGRQILPPMPWPNYGQMTDADLKAVFAYLRQVPAVKNKVPDPIPPMQ